MRKTKWSALLLIPLLCLALSGCRVRTSGTGSTDRPGEQENTASVQTALPGSLPEESADASESREEEAPGEQTRENPEASRREYDENAPAEIVPGTDRAVHGEGEGSGAFAPGEEPDAAVAKLNSEAEETATQTVAAEQAEQMGVDENAKEADSAMTYFTVLLQDRMGGLFECQRLYVYWETPEDHVTVFKTSPEHDLILGAGAYDVSARLLEENLRVDDGWIGRKNPGVIVKVVDRSVLGAGVSSTGAAQRVYEGLLAREGWAAIDAVRNGRVLLLSEELLGAPHLQTAAMLAIAKTANPSLLADVELARAIEMLSEEAAGSIPAGIFAYGGHGGL